jgi:hypothetical protein
MFKTLKAKIITLALVGVVALGGAVYLTTALATGGASATPAPVQTTQTATTEQLRSTILEMLNDHMGLTGTEAERLADQMAARMQSAGANIDIQAMIDRCPRFNDNSTADSGTGDNSSGPGMMNQNGSTYGRGMMNGSGSGYGNGMMGGWSVQQ